MTKKRRVYIARVVGGQLMTSADLERLHKELLEFERIDAVFDETRALIHLPPSCEAGAFRSSGSAGNVGLSDVRRPARHL